MVKDYVRKGGSKKMIFDWMSRYESWKWDVFFIILLSMFIGYYVPRLVISLIGGNMIDSIICMFVLVFDVTALVLDCRNLNKYIMILKM